MKRALELDAEIAPLEARLQPLRDEREKIKRAQFEEEQKKRKERIQSLDARIHELMEERDTLERIQWHVITYKRRSGYKRQVRGVFMSYEAAAAALPNDDDCYDVELVAEHLLYDSD